MASLKELHELIHKLDKNEKKYLSMMIEGISGKAKGRYANSLRHINAQTEFDADRLKSKLSGDVSGMNLSEANSNLYQFICRSLVSYHNTTSENMEAQKNLLLVEILINKGLYTTALRITNSILEELGSRGSYGILQRALELQIFIYLKSKELKVAYEERMQLYNRRLQLLDENRQFVELQIANTRFFELTSRLGDPRTKSQLDEFLDLAKSSVLQIEFENINTRSLSTYTTLKLALNEMAGEESVFNLGERAILEIKKRYRGREYFLYWYFVIDYLIAESLSKKNIEKVKEYLVILDKLYPNINDSLSRQKIKSRTLFAQLSLCIWNKDWERADVLLKDRFSAKGKKEWMEDPLAYLNMLNAARIQYLKGQQEKSLDYLLELQAYEKVMRPSVMLSYRFLFLLCHYKLENFQLLSYATESLYRILLKMDKLYAPERAMLRFVKKASKPDKVKDALLQLHDELESFQDDKFSKPFFAFGDYMAWLSAEISRARLR